MNIIEKYKQSGPLTTEQIANDYGFSEIEAAPIDSVGKRVTLILIGKSKGTEADRLVLEFEDGTTLVVQEEGQAGYFSITT